MSSGRDYECKDEKAISSRFAVHLRTLKKHFEEDSDAEDDGLGAQASRLRSVSVLLSQLVARMTDGYHCPHQLTRQRYLAAQTHSHLVAHAPILSVLGFSGNSEDESEHEDGERRFRIVEPDWRSAELTKWLRVFDGIYSSTKFNDANRPSRGNWTRIRIPPLPGAPKSNRKPPHHLPRNFFRPGYIESLLDHEVEKLDIDDKDYNLTHSEEVIG